jgi:hypothetical protein
MDATHGIQDLDPRRDTVACAALLLAMVISILCVAFVVEFEASDSSSSTHPEASARCTTRCVSIF